MRAALALVVLSVACGGAPPPGPSNTAETRPPAAPSPEPAAARSDRQAVELAIQLIGEMAEAAARGGGMCDQVGESISAIAVANEDVFARLGAISADPDRARTIEEHRQKLDAAIGALLSGIGDCGGHPAVGAAMESMAVN